MPSEVLYNDNDFKTYRGYRLLAIDGTTIELPDFKCLRERFCHVGNRDKTVRAKSSGLIDMENGMVLSAEIDNYRIHESILAYRHLAELKQLGYRNDLILYDRGYPSKKLIAYHLNEGIDFVMRAIKRSRVFIDAGAIKTAPMFVR